ncbi:vitamin B12 ABC transporter ATP-binding protein BtuD [Enterobacteriaceae bacterium LUAb1]
MVLKSHEVGHKLMRLEIVQAGVALRLQPLNAQVTAGKMIHLLGPNGSGKSTLLSMLAGLQPYTGHIMMEGISLDAWDCHTLARRRGWLHQQQSPHGQMPVFHYLQQFLPLRLETRAEVQVNSLLQVLRLDNKLTKSIHQLSGGEWQRVRLAGVLLQSDPQINPQAALLLLDEPLTGLDVAQQRAAEQWLTVLCRHGLSVIMSGHDLNHTLQQADEVWLLKAGSMVRQGPPDVLLQPELLSEIFDVPFRRLSLPEGTFLFC